jgi:hypothetical protein
VSLADELADETRKPSPGLVDEWLARWYPTLNDADRQAWDDAVDNPRQQAAGMYRVARRHGFAGSECIFRRWVAQQRGAS